MIENWLDFDTGMLKEYRERIVRRAENMRGFFLNEEALNEAIENGNPVIYEVYAVPNEGEGELSYAITVLHPGKIGREYHMTKGHYHEKRDRGELYIGLRGEGLLLMQKDNEVKWYPMRRGSVLYVPPFWAHRSVNTGKEDFVFLAIYPGDAGHDYGSIADKGFAKVVVERDGKFSVEDNPRW